MNLTQQLTTGVMQLILIALIAVIAYVGKLLKQFILAHTNEKERALVTSLINDAVPYVQTLFPGVTPAEMIQKATGHVVALALQKGIKTNETEISAAVAALLKTA